MTAQNDEIADVHSSERYFAFASDKNIYILQYDERFIDEFDVSSFTHITALPDRFILTGNNTELTFSISTGPDVFKQITGLIVIRKKPDNFLKLSDFIERLSDHDANCWAGGEGARNCNVGVRNSELTVSCNSAYYPCCNRDLFGFCVKK